ncbi:hypothetical protein BDC45DRAFT_521904 [Circinella umbellata]|nr:hypothetical protein BDC45DRAFT_521904 [Circinella umbellata]
MNSQFTQAVKDAREIITYKPTLATGYLRLGSLYQMQGRQKDAIEAYSLGLQSVSQDDPEYAQLVCGKDAASQQNDKRVDFVALLPVEIANRIILKLSYTSKAAGLTVSNTWRKRVLSCTEAWTTIVTGNDDPADRRVASYVSQLARHVQCLTTNSQDQKLCSKYMLSMRNGQFDKLQWLSLKASVTKLMTQSISATMTLAFWHIRNTLTKFELDYDTNKRVSVKVADILFTLPNLHTFSFKTGSVLSLVIGSMDLVEEPHNTLADLEIHAQAASITGEIIKPLLLQCQKLRRLCLVGCTTTVLQEVNQHCENLELFGYNYKDGLPALYQPQRKISKPAGLKQIYTNNGGALVPGSDFLPLIYRNMSTLTTIFANLDESSGINFGGITKYPNFNLDKLTSLTLWPNKKGQPSDLIRAISTCKNLNSFSALNICDFKPIVDTLVKIPPTNDLMLVYANEENNISSLVQLFNYYASKSENSKSLQNITLRLCQKLSNSVLKALGKVKTLQVIHLENLPLVTKEGLHEFLEMLPAAVYSITVSNMSCVSNDTMTILSEMKCLRYVYLEELSNVTDVGIMELANKSKSLHTLSIKKCRSIPDSAIVYAKQLVDTVIDVTEDVNSD